MSSTILHLKKNEERRLLAGHPWIYSNEVNVKVSPLNGFDPGQTVVIENSQGKPMGSAYVNPHSLICARLISRDPAILLNQALLTERLHNALALRERFFAQPFYRWVFGESDNLPGLVIDRYGDTLVVQITTAGMERMTNQICAALLEIANPQAILLRNDTAVRTLEGLETYIKPLYGNPAKQIELEENGTRFLVPIWEGQKTGWFYDQRLNRSRLKNYVTNKRVLDVFSYIG